MSFAEHIATGATTLAGCWAVIRRDGEVFGFTDHDNALSFEGITFKADAGLTARAIASGTGLSVDNSEAMGALSDVAVTEADIEAGRFDGAEVKAWLVNWADVSERCLRFAGSIGEIRRASGAFHAELRGLTDALNQPHGRVYQPGCAAILGDNRCQVDLSDPGMFVERPVEVIEEQRRFVFQNFSGFEPAWFERGRIRVLTGAAKDLVAIVKRDRFVGPDRYLEVWEAFRASIKSGDVIRIEAGCDKQFETCRSKFGNLLNFQGFPDIPGDDWLMTTPQSANAVGGSLRRFS